MLKTITSSLRKTLKWFVNQSKSKYAYIISDCLLIQKLAMTWHVIYMHNYCKWMWVVIYSCLIT